MNFYFRTLKQAFLHVTLLALLLPFQQIAMYGQALQIHPSYRLHPGTTTQTEVLITAHPHDPDILFASANAINFSPFFVSEGIYVSTDGGSSWFGSDTCNGNPIPFHGGDPGIAIDKEGNFILTRLGSGPFTGLYSHYSSDQGLNWSAQNTITTDLLERAAVASDGNPASSYYGRTYAAWVKLFAPYPAFISYSDDGGASWTSQIQVNNPNRQSAGGDIAVSSDGKVHVCWAGIQSASPFTEISIGYASSTDGGQSWFVNEQAFDTRGIKGLMPEKSNIRVDGLPRLAVDNSGLSRNGWIYIVSAQKGLAPAGNDPDIILRRSTDGGASWSPGIRVNQDPENNGKIQFMPAIAIDGQGGVNVLYYDDRTTSADSAGVFLSRSTDGGDTWQDYEIADHHFKPLPLGGLGQGYQGDNIDILAVGTTLHPVWMDNSSGIYQVWGARVDISPNGLDDRGASGAAANFILEQNYPNPFNGGTQIGFRLPKSTNVLLEIFAVDGKKVATLLNQPLPAGSHRVQWEPGDLPGGIYFYRLRQGALSQTKKLLLIR